MKYNIDKKLNGFAPLGTASDFGKNLNGGKGSGNFGHSGRPGYVGGSASTGSSSAIATSKTKLDDITREYEQSAYEGAVRVYESEMGSLMREIDEYAKNTKALKESRPQDVLTQYFIERNNKKIEELKEKGRKEILGMAAKSAEYHFGTGTSKKESVGWSVKIGNDDDHRIYLREEDVKQFQKGAKDSYRSKSITTTEPKKNADGVYDVVYKGSDVGVGFSTRDRNEARHYSEGWNAASKKTDEIRSNLLKSQPQFEEQK